MFKQSILAIILIIIQIQKIEGFSFSNLFKSKKQLEQQDYEDVKVITQQFESNFTFPGSQLQVFQQDDILYTQFSGKLTYEGDKFDTDVDENTIYDMASVTKVMSTTSAVMLLYEQGRIKLNDKMIKYLPQADNNGKQEITIKNLLLHNAGLPPDYEPFDQIKQISKEQFIDWLYNCQLQYPVGTDSIYSDLSMVFLQLIVEQVSEMPLNKFVDQFVFQKLGMFRTEYQPSVAIQSAGYCAPTELDTTWRVMLCRCVVHDPTAYVMGGVSGNAGLFSYYADATKFMQMMVNYGTYNNIQIFKASTVQVFTTREEGLPYKNTRALGWDTCGNSVPQSCGKYFGANAFGHTGYTGTQVWADKNTGLGVIILTNRVYPDDNVDSKNISWYRYNTMNKICEINGYK